MIDTNIIKLLKNSRRVAVLTGAGISAESGVPTFRGADGLWKNYRPEELASPIAFRNNPDMVWEWYSWRKNLIKNCAPNPGHYALAKMEKLFEKFTLITQNVDGIHRQAGSDNILELHGNINRNFCCECRKEYPDNDLVLGSKVNRCSCGGLIRPAVVWFGENLPEEVLEKAFSAVVDCDLFISIGTSSVVYPAALMPLKAKEEGAALIEINMEPTPLTPESDFFLKGACGVILPNLMEDVHNA